MLVSPTPALTTRTRRDPMLVSPTPALTAQTRRDPMLVSCIYCRQQINCLRRTCPYLIQLMKKIPYNIHKYACNRVEYS